MALVRPMLRESILRLADGKPVTEVTARFDGWIHVGGTRDGCGSRSPRSSAPPLAVIAIRLVQVRSRDC